MGFYPREGPPLWWIVGGGRQKPEETSRSYRRQREAQLRGALNRFVPDRSLPQQQTTCAPTADGIEALTPGHFLIGRPLEAIPNSDIDNRPITALRRWPLCQSLLRHFWQRWSSEYLVTLQKLHKWRRPAHNLAVGDVVVLREDTLAPMRWPMARIVKTHAGADGLVRVVTLKTSLGTYTRPTSKVALLLPNSNS